MSLIAASAEPEPGPLPSGLAQGPREGPRYPAMQIRPKMGQNPINQNQPLGPLGVRLHHKMHHKMHHIREMHSKMHHKVRCIA